MFRIYMVRIYGHIYGQNIYGQNLSETPAAVYINASKSISHLLLVSIMARFLTLQANFQS